MGLDMYAMKTRTEIPPVDFDGPKGSEELFYWRKHPNLHGWMQQLYKAKGGEDPNFDLSTLRLDPVDLDALEKAVNNAGLPQTTGFFFGVSTPDDKEDDMKFLQAAREAIADGYNIYYYAWW